jgi:hypothetical protein
MLSAIVFIALGGAGVAVFCHSHGRQSLLGLSLSFGLPESPFT